MLWDLLCQPFVEFDFMRHALLGIVCLALGTAPLGVLLQLRRIAIGRAPGDAVKPLLTLLICEHCPRSAIAQNFSSSRTESARSCLRQLRASRQCRKRQTNQATTER